VAVIEPVDSAAGTPDKYFRHDQNVPSATWSVTHNLGKHPSVSVVDSADTVVHGEVVYIDDNTLELRFATAFGGRAYLN
jgi:hypothetical protein